MTGANLVEYYRERATEYDSIYEKPERQGDLAILHGLLAGAVAGRNVLEVAAGTGYWTQALATSAVSVVATDINQEMLKIARKRHYDIPVRFEQADAFALHRVEGTFDTVVLGFFWSHLFLRDLPRFMKGLHSRLGAGASMVAVDNRYVPGSSTSISRTGTDGDTYQIRSLRDGRRYEIVKNFPTREEFTDAVRGFVTEVEWTETDYYWLSVCTLR